MSEANYSKRNLDHFLAAVLHFPRAERIEARLFGCRRFVYECRHGRSSYINLVQEKLEYLRRFSASQKTSRIEKLLMPNKSLKKVIEGEIKFAEAQFVIFREAEEAEILAAAEKIDLQNVKEFLKDFAPGPEENFDYSPAAFRSAP